MENLEGFDFFRLESNGDGKFVSAAPVEEIKKHIADAKVSDVIFIAHGFRNDANDATDLYRNFLHSFRADIALPEFSASLGNRKIAVVGVYWPSKKFSEGGDVPAGDAIAEGGASDGTGGNGGGGGGGGTGGTQSIGGVTPDVLKDRAHIMQLLQDMKSLVTQPDHAKRIDDAIALLPTVEHSSSAVNEFVAHIISIVDESNEDPTEGFSRVKATPGSELIKKLAVPILLPTLKKENGGDGKTTSVDTVGSHSADQRGGILSIGSAFKSITGKLGQFLNLTTWYIMKNMAGKVGANALADCVREIRKTDGSKSVRIHLVGHSLGGRLMTATAKALTTTPGVTVNSLTLLEAAFSHYGFSSGQQDNAPRGFFREVIETPVVTGPIAATFSYQDTVVGIAYAISSRLAGDNAKSIGDAYDVFGGIGRNGAQKTVESTSAKLQKSGSAYGKFALNVVNCFDGSGGLIKNHSDITNADVSYLFASVMSNT